MSAPSIKIPAEPLLKALQDAGGLHALPSLGEASYDDEESTATYERTPAQVRLLRTLRGRVTRARKRGWIDLFQADEIICDHLGTHPMSIYGWDWITFGDNDETGVTL